VNSSNDHSRFVSERLEYLAASLGGTQILDLRRLTGGASKETWSFDLKTATGNTPLILRRLPGHSSQHEIQMSLSTEAAVISAVAKGGVKVPEVRHVLCSVDQLGEGFVMARVSGETIPRKIIRDPAFAAIRPQLAFQFGAELARIHQLDCSALPALRLAPASQALTDLQRDLERCTMPRPVFALALQWLKHNAPSDPVTPALVHGDFRNGNIIFNSEGIAAVLDWELAHLGDPMEDFGWLFMTPWRFGQIDLPAGGLGTREQAFAGYRQAGGIVDIARVKFWEVAGCLRWGMTCDYALSQFEQHAEIADIEHAMIARRASETEVDLLRMLCLED